MSLSHFKVNCQQPSAPYQLRPFQFLHWPIIKYGVIMQWFDENYTPCVGDVNNKKIWKRNREILHMVARRDSVWCPVRCWLMWLTHCTLLVDVIDALYVVGLYDWRIVRCWVYVVDALYVVGWCDWRIVRCWFIWLTHCTLLVDVIDALYIVDLYVISVLYVVELVGLCLIRRGHDIILIGALCIDRYM
jgi:hypothetical protein